MKSIKLIALSAFLTIGAFCTVLYTSCSKDECKDVVCLNGGTCSGGTCVSCNAGYEGDRCETVSRDKFIKTWNAADDLTGGSTHLVYTVSINVGSGTAVTNASISKAFSDDFFNNPISATVSGNTITIPSQNPDGNNYSLTGTGTISGGKITWSYTIKNDLTSVSQVYTGTWQ